MAQHAPPHIAMETRHESSYQRRHHLGRGLEQRRWLLAGSQVMTISLEADESIE